MRNRDDNSVQIECEVIEGTLEPVEIIITKSEGFPTERAISPCESKDGEDVLVANKTKNHYCKLRE